MKEQQSSERSALEKAALMIKQLKEKLEQQEKLHSAPIAVVGIACRFPGDMNTAAEFWNGLKNGIDTVGELPADRWQQHKKEKLYGSFLQNIDAFDASFFGISPREAKAMDPQQRLLLETSWLALEDAGIPASLLKGTQTGVFVGAMSHDYSEWCYEDGLIDVYTGTGTSNSILAGRLSHYYDWNGPAMAIDTACSSSLVAIHQAVRSLRAGESDTCVVAGVNAILSPSLYNIETVNQMLSPDGRCKTFDEKANGFARGEGAGVVILKRLEDAIKNNDRVYCVIKGSAVNHDGKSTGLMAPSQLAQEQLIQSALKDAKLPAAAIDFVECHGTGTSLGDPVEVGALQDVYGKDRTSPLHLGAVKSNMGHLEGAAGIAGFMKMALSVYHAGIPPNVHFNAINPYINNKNIIIPAKNIAWNSSNRTGAISSFGFSGTNAHVIVQSYAPAEVAAPTKKYLPLAFSASSQQALKTYIEHYKEAVSDVSKAYTLSCKREQLAYRALFFTQEGTLQPVAAIKAAEWLRLKPKVVFLFSGQGSQYKEMGALLYQHHPAFKKYFDQCNALYNQVTGNDLWEYISGSKTDELNNTSVTQPALFAISYATACMWREHGVVPDALVGHSIGEWAAACFAGMLSLADAMKLVVARGQLMEATAQGIMYAVAASYETIKEKVAAYEVDIAAVNAPAQVVLSGAAASVKDCIAHLETAGFKCRQLNVTRAFHSRLMHDAANMFAQVVKDVEFKQSGYPIYNNIDGELLSPELIHKGYWAKQITTAVNYQNCIEKLHPEALLFEIGPGNTLVQLAQKINPAFKGMLPGLCTVSHPDAFYKSFKHVFENGLTLNFEPFFDKKYIPVSLPPYAFQRLPYWIKDEVKTHLIRNSAKQSISHPALYRRDWVDFEMPISTNAVIEGRIINFGVAENISEADSLLVRFSQMLAGCVEQQNNRVIVVADLQDADAHYQYAMGMALLACLQSAMLEHQGRFLGIVLKMDASPVKDELLFTMFENPTALMLKEGIFKQLQWNNRGAKGKGLVIHADKSYVVYGGSGSVGLEIAKYLAANKAGSIVLTGRRNYEVLDIQYQYAIDTLKKAGADISYHSINNTEQLDEVLKVDGRALGGIFNAAGSYTNLSVSKYEVELLNGVLKPKVNDTISLLAVCKMYQADFLFNCSSAVTMTGAPMLGHYAFANAFMDGLAEQEKELDIYSVAWGGWKGSNMLSDGSNEAFQQKWGFHATDAESMIHVLDVLAPGCTAAVDIDWDAFFTTAHSAKNYAPLRLFINDTVITTANAADNTAHKTWSRKEIYDTVYKITSTILQQDSVRLEPTLPFDELGFNSLLALELSNELNVVFFMELSATIVYEHTTPEKLAKYIAGVFIQKTTLPNTSSGNSNTVLVEEGIDDLSLEELKSLLDKKINN
jgi:acyl transferase domain-containing protein/short-subunit dehydrogenase/acyl carrier protein